MFAVEYTKCNFCSSDNYKILYSEGTLKLVKCNNCGFCYVNPRVSEKSLLSHYDEKFKIGTEQARRKLRDVPKSQAVVTDDSNWSENQRECARKWIDTDIEYINKYIQKGRMLDVGCGDGNRLKSALLRGWSDIYGLEMSDAAISVLKKADDFSGLDKRFYNSSIIDAGFPNDFFDVITYWSVLEHVVDPLENIKKAYALLKKGGIIAIRVPNVRQEFLRKYVANILKFILPGQVKRLCGLRDLRPISFNEAFDLTKNKSGDIGGLELELHVNHFSDKTLAMFLKECGFEIIKNANGDMKIPAEGDVKILVRKIISFLTNIPYYCTMGTKFNLSEQILLIAKKP